MKRSIGVKLAIILVLSVFCLSLTSCFIPGGAGHTNHLPPKHIEVGVPTTLELGFVSAYPGSFGENKVQCHYRLTGEATFRTIPMVRVRRKEGKEGKKGKKGRIYSCTLPAFSAKQKEQFGSVEYYLDFYHAWPTNTSYNRSDYVGTTEFNRKLEEAKAKGEDVVVVHGRAYKFSIDEYLLDVEQPIPHKIPLR